MISITVEGTVEIKSVNNQLEIEIDGKFCNSGCQDEKLIKSIGLNNIVDLSDNFEILTHFDLPELCEYITDGDYSEDEISDLIEELQRSMAR